MASCSVCGISKHSDRSLRNKESVVLHPVPRNEDERRKWELIFPKVKLHYVCSQHFMHTDYEDDAYGNLLKKDAIPKPRHVMGKYKSYMQKQNLESREPLVKNPMKQKIIIHPEELSNPETIALKPFIKIEHTDAYVCRVCLSQEKSSVVSLTAKQPKRTVAEMIFYISGIRTSFDDNLPQSVCSTCFRSLENACDLKDLCIQSNNYFKSQFDKEMFKIGVKVLDRTEQQDSQSQLRKDSFVIKDVKTLQKGKGHRKNTEVEAETLKYDEAGTIIWSDELESILEEIDSPVYEEVIEVEEDRIEKFETDHDDYTIKANDSYKIEEADPVEPMEDDDIEYEEYEEVEVLDEEFIMEMEQSKTTETKKNVIIIDETGGDEESSLVTYLDISNQSHENKFRCLICQMLKFDVEFDTEKEKVEHLKTHPKEELQCKICLRQMVFAKMLDKHLERHQLPTQLYTVPKIESTPPAKPKMPTEYKCYICGLVFFMRSQKDAHLNTEHADYNLRCKLCLKKFRSITGMDNHLRVHENPELLSNMCYICGKFYEKAYELNTHLNHYHGAKKLKYICDLCGHVSKQKMQLKNHILNSHSNVKQFCCDECPGKGYTTKVALDNHKIIWHGMETDFFCHDCHRFFVSLKVLEVHQERKCPGNPNIIFKGRQPIDRMDASIYREKIDENTYRCKVCGKLFYGDEGKNKVPIHYANMHRYTCDQCPAHYKNKILLDQHIHKAHTYSLKILN